MNEAILLGIVGIGAIAAVQIVSIFKPNGTERINQSVSTIGIITGFAFGVGLS